MKKAKIIKPCKRVGLRGETFKDTVDEDWICVDGIHACLKYEMNEIQPIFFKCEVTGKWYDKNSGFQIYGEDKFVHTKAWCGIYIKCEIDGCLYRKEDCREIINSYGDKDLVSPPDFYNYYMLDDYDKSFHHRDEMKVVRWVNGIHWMSISNIERSGILKLCNLCNVALPIKHFPLIRNYHIGSVCLKCAEILKKKDIIKPHDYKNYPDKISKVRLVKIVEFGKIISVEQRASRLFGVEAETEFVKNSGLRHDFALDVSNAIGSDFAIIKHDGSLSGTSNSQGPGTGGQYGFEIVTAPCCIETLRERLPSIALAKCYKYLRSWDTLTCGFHVHVSRRSLTLLQIGRILSFVNHPNNKYFVQKVAGRSEDKYCKYFPKKLSSGLEVAGGDLNERRRVAVNLENPETIEFRIFRGTVNPKHMIRNIEFVDALCDFCYPASRSFRDVIDPFKFIEFVSLSKGGSLVGDKWVSCKKWPVLYDWFVFHEAIKQRPRKDMPVEIIEEVGPKKKYKFPENPIDHSIGILMNNKNKDMICA